jgi:isopentenyl-diphosphate Delta-isomerase
MAAVSEDMLIDSVNESDIPIGTVPRKDVFKRRANFRVAHVLVFNSAGELLIQQLALTRSRHAGLWGSSVAAYLHAGETYEQAARRRLREELGIMETVLEYVGKTTMTDEGSRKFIGVFRTIADGRFPYDTRHIEHLQFLPVSEIRSIAGSSGKSFTQTFLQVLTFYESKFHV